MSKIRVIIKKPNEKPSVELVENDAKAAQKIVGGYAEYTPLPEAGRAYLVTNEEGKLVGLPFNFNYHRLMDRIVGTVFFAAADGDELCSLTDNQIKIIQDDILHE